MPQIFFLILMLLPFLELFLLIQVGAEIGGGSVLLLVFLTGLLGIGLMRLQGAATVAVLSTLSRKLAESEATPDSVKLAQGIISALAPGLAGVLLLIPGFITDLLGVLVLLVGLPGLLGAGFGTHQARGRRRVIVIEGMTIDLETGESMTDSRPGGSSFNTDDVIDVDYEEIRARDEDKP